MDDAFARSKLPTPAPFQDEPLGADSWDMWVNHTLMRAGITVERVGTPAYGNENDSPMHLSVQIVSQQSMDRAMKNDKLEHISFCGTDEVLGLQVKLNNAYGWKVTTLTEIPDRGATAGSRSTRKRAVAEESTVVQSRNLHEIVVNCSESKGVTDLRATVAMALAITINIAFKTDDDGDPVIHEDGHPAIAQRRVDVVFANKHVVTTQVCSGTPCSVFCVLCSATCNLRYGTQHLLRAAAVGILRRRHRSRRLAQQCGLC